MKYAKHLPGFAYRARLTHCEGRRRGGNGLSADLTAFFDVLRNGLNASALLKNGACLAVVSDVKGGLLHCERPPFTMPEAAFGGGEDRLYDCIWPLFCHVGMAKQGFNNASLWRNAWQGRAYDVCFVILFCHDFLLVPVASLFTSFLLCL